MNLYLLEPDTATREWAPFGGVRPVAELRAGVFRIRERWERVLGCPTTAIIDSRMAGFEDVDNPPVEPAGSMIGPAVVVDSRFAPSLTTKLPARFNRLVAGDRSVAWFVAQGESWDGPTEAGSGETIPGLGLTGVADLLDGLAELLTEDLTTLAEGFSASVPGGTIVVGGPDDVLVRNAQVEPGVVFDVRGGPVVIDGAEIRSGTRLEGPLFVGPGTVVLGGAVRRSVVGPACRINGELASSVFLGYANKAHDGFVGHSVVGAWANLGALTTTSNLKNTYGEIRLETPAGRWDTGRQFLGSLVGDHAKTAIGTMLGTGTIVGTGANVFGAAPVPKYVAPFAWGVDGDEKMSEAGFLTVASRVLPRRAVDWTPERQASLVATYARMAGMNA